MEVHTNSRLTLGRNKGCTNASKISPRRWEYGGFENEIPHSVQTVHNSWRACQINRKQQRRIVPSIKILANSRLILGRNKGCTDGSNISPRSWGYGEFENGIPHFVQRAHKPWRVGHCIRNSQRRIITLFPDLTYYSFLLKSHSPDSSKMSSGTVVT